MMLRPRRGPSVVASKRRRIRAMCFGGGPAIPKTEIEYEKKDFGPLPSLSVGEPMDRSGPSYQTVRRGSKVRSLLAPMQ